MLENNERVLKRGEGGYCDGSWAQPCGLSAGKDLEYQAKEAL